MDIEQIEARHTPRFYRGTRDGETRVGVTCIVETTSGPSLIWREYISDGRGLVWHRNRSDVPDWATEAATIHEDWRETALHHQEVADDYRDHANAMARQRDALQAKIDAVREALDHIEQSPYANASTEIRRALGEQ